MSDQETILRLTPPTWGLALATILTILLSAYLVVLTWNKYAEHDYIGRTDQQIYTISLEGEGKITATPDIAEITLGLMTEKISVAEAQKENTDKMNRIIAELKKMSIEEKDIKTTNYSIYPRYDWADGKQTLKGYQVSQSVAVKIRNLDKIGAVLEMAGRLGANQTGGLSFTIDEPEKLKQQAREKALLNAKEKAEALAKVAGVKLGRLVSFTESSGNTYPVYRDFALKSAEGLGGAAPAPEIEAGSQDVIVDISVTYEVL